MSNFAANAPMHQEDNGYDGGAGIGISAEEDALNWIGGALDAPHPSPNTHNQFAGDLDLDKLRSGIQAVMQIVPAIVQALRNNPESQETLDALSGLGLEAIDSEEGEVWPAVIGAVVSALPTVISAVGGLVKKGRKDSRKQPAPRPAAPGQRRCPEPRHHQPPSRENTEGATDAEAIPWATLLSTILELLPTILPIIAQLLTMTSKALPSLLDGFSKMSNAVSADQKKEGDTNPETDSEAIEWSVILPIVLGLLPIILPIIAQLLKMISTALPSLLDGFSKMSKTIGAGTKKENVAEYQYEDRQRESPKAKDSLHELSDEQIAAIWEDALEDEFIENPEAVE